jgi:hypothetical protein
LDLRSRISRPWVKSFLSDKPSWRAAVLALRNKASESSMVVFTSPYSHIYGTRATKQWFGLAFPARMTSGIGILIVLTGVPVYFAWRKRLPFET